MKRLTQLTERLTLRPLKISDYGAWREAQLERDPAHNRWDMGPVEPRFCTRAAFKKAIARQAISAKTDDLYWYGIFEKKSGQLIGHIEFDVFKRSTHQFANYAYQIYNRHWGKGFGPEAAAAGLRIGFQQLKLNRLEAAINLDNRISLKLAKSIGMRKEGIKKRYWFEFGRWVDHVIYVANPEDIGLEPTKPF